MKQLTLINKFVKDAKYYMVKMDNTENGEIGKILDKKELGRLDLENNEIWRSTKYKNGNMLFIHDLLPKQSNKYIDNPLELIKKNLQEARAIEKVYPGIFRWVFDGVNLKALAIVPSGNPRSNSTISRYGGTKQFIRILKQHLRNIGKMNKGATPDYSFLKNDEKVEDEILSVGSVNRFNDLYCVPIDVDDSYMDIIRNSNEIKKEWKPLNVLRMKYWTREINPDFLTEAKHRKLDKSIDIDETYEIYPQPIKALMNLKEKGNYNRFLLARFLLSVHNPKDAKFVYYSVLADEELKHVKNGNCSTQWNYILNNMERYGCPTNKELKHFIDWDKYDLDHPLEEIQKKIEGEEDGN